MRASKLITLSAAAVLVGGTSLALGQGSLQSGSSVQSSGMSQGSVRGFEPKKFRGARAGGQKTAWQQGKLRSQGRQSIGPSERGAYARGSARELGEAGVGPSTQGVRDMMREIPRLSNIGSTEIRIDAVVPKRVRQAAVPLPPEVQRLHPRLRRDRAFMYRDQVVIVDPTTSRIVALFKA